MKDRLLYAFFLWLMTVMSASAAEQSLVGAWEVSLSDPKTDSARWQPLVLPGTLDDARIGAPLGLRPELTLTVLARLQRKFTYVGPAWYRRDVEIPGDWAGKRITLELERVLWESRVFVDGREVSRADSLTTPHRHDLSAALVPGRHELMIRIDNTEIHPGLTVHARAYPGLGDAMLAHAYTNHTQITWNGVLGSLRLIAADTLRVDDLVVTPRLIPAGALAVRATMVGEVRSLRLVLRGPEGETVAESIAPVTGPGFVFDWPLPAGMRAWDEFFSHLYRLDVYAEHAAQPAASARFGFRDLAVKDRDFQLNGRRLFLRGNLECVIFPLTGYPPTDVAAWKKLFLTAKTWGLNHFRFHSWCPPSAAFNAADEVGFYLQVELPHWSLNVGENRGTWEYLKRESDRILADYGNHPSFMFFSLGNELQGDMELLNAEVRRLRERDPRRLYTTTTFTFKKGHGRAPEPADDYFITQYTADGWVRGQGVFNEQPPAFNGDYRAASANIAVPLVQHEVGQYSVYPDLSEIPHYTGNLVPLNFIAIRNDLAKKNLLELAPKFTAASGRFAALLYKEEIERTLRTPELDGFQLLQLQDFPGQGTALVGLLNAFWEPKGVITAVEFREFCASVVPLARFPKAIYERGEKFSATVEVANFLEAMPDARLEWTIRDQSGTSIGHGTIGPVSIAVGNGKTCGAIELPIPMTGGAARWRLDVVIAGTAYRNHWNLWVFPRAAADVLPAKSVHIVTTLDAAITALAAGERVFFNPPVERIAGIPGKFVPVFWSPVHFRDQPGTMGLLCEPAHPALQGFPTEAHSDWQWWDLTLRSKSVVLDGLRAGPIVRVIDNFNRNHSLANVFEAWVGRGRLLFSAIDLMDDLATRPAARQLRASLLAYAGSTEFSPAGELTVAQLRGLWAVPVKQ